MKKIIACLVALQLIVAVDAFSLNPKSYWFQHKALKKELLYLIHAKAGHIQVDKKEKDKGALILKGVNQSVTYVASFPKKKAGKISLKKFLAYWGLGTQSPVVHVVDAGLIFYEGQDENGFSDISVLLHNPSYDSKSNELTFEIEALGRNDKLEEKDIKEVSLLIDDITSFFLAPPDNKGRK